MSDTKPKKDMHPNSLANLNPGTQDKNPIRNLARKIRGYTDEGEAVYKMVYAILIDKDEKSADRLHAAEILLNRGFGKAVETIVIEELNPIESELKQYPLSELRSIRDALTVEAEYRLLDAEAEGEGGTPESTGVGK